MKSLVLVLVNLVAVSLVGETVSAEDVRGVYRTSQGIEDLQKEKLNEGHGHLLAATVYDPLSAKTHFNLGNSFLLREEFGKAFKAFRTARSLAKNNPQLQFQSYFNMAVAATGLKDLNLALSSYQAALEIQPESIEVKTNIELLLKGDGGGGEGNPENKDKSSNQQQNEQQQKDQEKQDQQKDPQEEKDANDPKQEKDKPKPQPTPAKYKEIDLKEHEVQMLLEELKRQEEQIRAKFEEKKTKGKTNGKDW